MRLRRSIAAAALVTAAIAPALHAAAAPGAHGATVAFHPPLPLVVVTEFVAPATPYGPGHRGVDLAASAGAEVRAIADGTVVYAGLLVNRGVVSIEHAGGLRSTYEPVIALVTAGQVLDQGDVIGTVQPSGSVAHAACAPATCLHLGARLPDRVYLDPMALFRPWQVRLKPWQPRD